MIKLEKRFTNNNKYADYEFEDETSCFDPLGVWKNGSEYYSRTYKCRVPKKLLEQATNTGNHTKLSNWIENHNERGIWI